MAMQVEWTKEQVEEAVRLIVLYEKTAHPDVRLCLWAAIQEGYCRECGIIDPLNNCQCCNDE